jgi:flagellar hook assembly protein FlgD
MNEEQDPTIRVLLRVRPLNTRELHHSSSSILHIDSSDNSVVNIVDVASGYGSGLETNPSGGGMNVGNNNTPKSYTYDAIYGPESTQLEVFDGVKEIVEAVCEGYNGTIVAYGQTGKNLYERIIDAIQLSNYCR